MASTHVLDRWMYKGGHPNWLARTLNRIWALLASRGIAPKGLCTLEVRGRRSGRTIGFPVVVADYEGRRYLVAMLGERTNWVANVRAADGNAVIRHRGTEEVRLKEVAPADRPAILRRYVCERSSNVHPTETVRDKPTNPERERSSEGGTSARSIPQAGGGRISRVDDPSCKPR